MRIIYYLSGIALAILAVNRPKKYLEWLEDDIAISKDLMYLLFVAYFVVFLIVFNWYIAIFATVCLIGSIILFNYCRILYFIVKSKFEK